MEKCCDICGDIGVSEAIISCSQCQYNSEHMYCMRTLLEEHLDDWLCEDCQSSSKTMSAASSPTRDFPNLSKLANCMEDCKGAALHADSRKLLNESRKVSIDLENEVATGKTTDISAEEAITVSSGAMKSLPPSKVYMMTGSVAMCAGSAGGAQPPPDPQRLPSHCESAPDVAPRPRKGRGRAKGYDIAARVAVEGKINLQFDERESTFKAIGLNAAWYDSAVGIHTRDICDPYYDTWRNVPFQQKKQIQEQLLEWFNIDYSYRGGIYREMVDRDAKKVYKDWKNDLYNHFKKFGGVDNLAAAKSNPPLTLREQSHWERCCDRFASDKFQKKSNINKANRNKQKWSSYHGRISYTQHRAKKANTITQEPISAIENWADMHRRGDTWVNPQAEKAYHMMKEHRQTQVAQSASGSAPLDERLIMEEVLGPRRGHMTGVGPTLPHIRSSASSHASQSGETSSGMRKEMRVLKDYVMQLREVIAQFAPNIPLPPVPPGVPPPESNAAHNHDEDDDDAALGD